MDKLINQQAAIDVVHKSIFDFFDICDDDEESPMTYNNEQLLKINKAITALIKALPSVQNPYWIPVSEDMPKGQELVNVSCHDTSGDTSFDYTSSGWVTTNGEYWIVDNEINNHVVAWMPLPEPYKEGK